MWDSSVSEPKKAKGHILEKESNAEIKIKNQKCILVVDGTYRYEDLED